MPKEYNKLVRDLIPKLLKEQAASFEERVATPEEYELALMKKLAEERAEFNKDKSIEELADITEVLEALKKITITDKDRLKEIEFTTQFVAHLKTLPEYANVEEVRLKKLAEKGGFEKRIIAKGKK